MRISVTGTPVPSKEVELKSSGSGPIKTYKLSPEEMERELEKFKPKSKEDEEMSIKYPHITKELLVSEFAKGKTGMQIEKEQGLPAGTLGYYMKKLGVRKPKSNAKQKPSNEKPVVVKSVSKNAVPAEVETAKKKVVEVKTVVKAVTDHNIDHDPVNHPSHYTAGQVECIDAIESATTGLTGGQAYATGAAIKYLWRWSRKGGAEDLKKAKWYINRLIELIEEVEALETANHR